MVGEGVAVRPTRSRWPRRSRKPKVGQRLEDRRPHRVEVDASWPSRRRRPRRAPAPAWHLADVQALARVLVGRGHALEHADVLAADDRRPGSDSGRGSAASSSPEAPPRIASRICCIRRDVTGAVSFGHERPDTASPSLLDRHSLEGAPNGRFVIVAGARTPIGKMSGALASFSAAELGGIAIKAALERAGVSPDEVDYVFMGQVLIGAARARSPARQAAVNGGHPDDACRPPPSTRSASPGSTPSTSPTR